MRNVWIVLAVCTALAAAPAAQARSLGTHTRQHFGTHTAQHFGRHRGHVTCPQKPGPGVPLPDLANKYLGAGAPCGLPGGVIGPRPWHPVK
jgi:hypothetical protein